MRYPVAIRFRGEHVQRVDDKCRLSIPASYRQTLEEHGDQRLILRRSLVGDCLEAVPVAEWEVFEEKLLALPQNDPAVVRIRRFLAISHEVVPDGHGRIVLPPSLRAFAGIQPSSQVTVIGGMKMFEIWDHEQWMTVSAQVDRTEMAADLLRLEL